MSNEKICPKYEAAVEFLGKKWTGLVIRVLLSGPKRFSDFGQYIPDLSDRLLSQRLKELERLGIVRRDVQSTTPVCVHYRLTEIGEKLENVVQAIEDWANDWKAP